MVKNAAVIGALLVFAFSILVTSTLRTATPQYSFSTPPVAEVLGQDPSVDSGQGATGSAKPVQYYLPHYGILPTHPLWIVKAVRDRLWLALTINDLKRANLLLLLGDKRIGMANELFSADNAEEGVPAAYKAEQYLEAAFNEEEDIAKSWFDTTDLLTRFALSALKHREVLNAISVKAPDDARPHITEALNITRRVYEGAKARLGERSRPIPQ